MKIIEEDEKNLYIDAERSELPLNIKNTGKNLFFRIAKTHDPIDNLGLQMKEQYYFEGVFYDTQKQLFEASKNYCKSPISTVSCKRILHHIFNNTIVNLIFNHEKTLSNHEFEVLCHEMMVMFISEFRKKIEEK